MDNMDMEQMKRMAGGMTGKLDELYAQVLGHNNGWLGGPGDGWERGPYWIDGLLPLAWQLGGEKLIAKTNCWVEWTLTHQRDDGYIGPVFEKPGGKNDRRAWWPKMVMLKILMQYFSATGDPRVIGCLTRYFRFPQQELPNPPPRPLDLLGSPTVR